MNIKKFLSFVPVFIFCFTLLLPPVFAEDLIVPKKIKEIFPDHAVAEKISKILNKNSMCDVVTQGELNNIRSFRCEGKKEDLDFIVNISGIQYLNNLNNLSIVNGGVFDLAPLSELTNLREITLRFNQVTDISPLSKLNNVTYLDLSCNLISDIRPLSSLTQLTYLCVRNNEIRDLSPLGSLKKLKILDISQNMITDLSPLTSLENLIELSAILNSIEKCKQLSDLKNLRILRTYPQNIVDNQSVLSKLKDWLFGVNKYNMV